MKTKWIVGIGLGTLGVAALAAAAYAESKSDSKAAGPVYTGGTGATGGGFGKATGFSGQTASAPWGGAGTLKATAGAAIINLPSAIASVDMGGTGTAAAPSGSSVAVTLNGKSGTISISGTPFAKYAAAPKATVTVS